MVAASKTSRAVDTSVRRAATLPAMAVQRKDSIIDCGAVSVPRHMLTPAATYSGNDSITMPRRMKHQAL